MSETTVQVTRAGSWRVDGPEPRWRARSWTWIALYQHPGGHHTREHGWTRRGAVMALAARLDGQGDTT